MNLSKFASNNKILSSAILLKVIPSITWIQLHTHNYILSPNLLLKYLPCVCVCVCVCKILISSSYTNTNTNTNIIKVGFGNRGYAKWLIPLISKLI